MNSLNRKIRNFGPISPKPTLSSGYPPEGSGTSIPASLSRAVATNAWVESLPSDADSTIVDNGPKAPTRLQPLFPSDASDIDSHYLPLFKPSSSVGHLEQDSGFWEAYIKEADAHDKELLEGWNNDLDIVLIFAGLFSAVNTSFIIESMSSLQANPADETNALLRILINRIDNTTFSDINVDNLLRTFTATHSAVRSNALFFSSLSCSLFAALGAVLGKQWLNQYDRLGNARAADARGRARQRKFDGVIRWHLRPVVESLTTLLQASLVLFFIALADFIWPIDKTVALVIVVMSAVVLVLDLVGLILAALYPDAPYQTPLTNGMRGFGDHCKDFFINFKKAAFRLHSQLKKKVEEVRKKHLQGDDEEAKEAIMDEKSDADHADETSKVTPRVLNKEGVLMDVLNGNSVGWLLQNTMDPDTALVAANAITLLASPNFDVEILLRLESLFSSCFKDSGWNSVLLKEGEREKAMVYGRALCHIIGSSPSEQREEGKTQFMKRLQKLHRTSAVVHRISYASRARDSELEMLDRIIHGFLELEPSAWRYNPSIKTSGGPFLGIKSWRTSQEVPHWILHLLLKHVDERSKQGDLGQEESLSFAVFIGSFLRKKPLPPVVNVSTIALILTVLLGGTLDDGTQQQVLKIDRSHEIYDNLTRAMSLDTPINKDTEPIFFSILKAIHTILSDALNMHYPSPTPEANVPQSTTSPLFNYVNLITAAQKLIRRLPLDQPHRSLLKITVEIVGFVAISQGHNRFYYRGGSWLEEDIAMHLRFLGSIEPAESAELTGGLRTLAFMIQETSATSPPNRPPLVAPASTIPHSRYVEIVKSEPSAIKVIVSSLESEEERQRDSAVSILYDATKLWFKEDDPELHKIFLEAGLSKSLLYYVKNMKNSRMSRRYFNLLDALAFYPSWVTQMIDDGHVTWLANAMHGNKSAENWMPDRAGETFLTLWNACHAKSKSMDMAAQLDEFLTQDLLDVLHVYVQRSSTREHKSLFRVIGPLICYVSMALQRNLIISHGFINLLRNMGELVEKGAKSMGHVYAEILSKL